MDALKADLHSQATKIGGLSPKFGMFATKPVMLRERRGTGYNVKKGTCPDTARTLCTALVDAGLPGKPCRPIALFEEG